jgi:hypothetical protein
MHEWALALVALALLAVAASRIDIKHLRRSVGLQLRPWASACR